MIIAYGILMPCIIVFLMTLLIAIPYNRDVKNGSYIPKDTYTKEDSIHIIVSYLLILCCSQYIWG